MSRKIIKLEQGQRVPEGAKFLYAQQEEVNVRHREVYEPSLAELLTLGLYYKTKTVKKYGLRTYFYYEIET
jgi:hypothetical protein